MRILVLIAIGLLLYVIISNLIRKNRPSPTERVTGKMVRCHHCGLHVLEQEAIQSGDDYYCSQVHLEEQRKSK